MRKELIAQKDPRSPITEIFRTLRTNIQFMNSSKGLKSLLLTSTMPEEGKSWIAANLAVTFAQTGKRVALVDADMRKGRLHTIFGVHAVPGFSNYLSRLTDKGTEGSEELSDYINKTDVENLFLIAAGSVPPNPSELLMSERMINMIPKLESFFDIIVFDGAPSVLVTDSVILSRFVDSTIIVAKYKDTKLENLRTIKRDIENVGGKIAGVVVNKVPISNKKYGTTYYADTKTRPMQAPKQPRKKDFEEDEDTEHTSTSNTLEELQKYLKKEKENLKKSKEDI